MVDRLKSSIGVSPHNRPQAMVSISGHCHKTAELLPLNGKVSASLKWASESLTAGLRIAGCFQFRSDCGIEEYLA